MAGERHSEKCTKEEVQQFKNKVIAFLIKEKLPHTKIIGLRCYSGQVKVFTGDTMSKMRLKMGRKLVAFKNPDGSYEGEAEAIQHLKETGGSQLWLRTNEPIEEKEYLPVYRVDDWEKEKQYLKEKLTQKETQ